MAADRKGRGSFMQGSLAIDSGAQLLREAMKIAPQISVFEHVVVLALAEPVVEGRRSPESPLQYEPNLALITAPAAVGSPFQSVISAGNEQSFTYQAHPVQETWRESAKSNRAE
jgi:hypothetical protein